MAEVSSKELAIAVCKDTVTMLGEIPQEQLSELIGNNGNSSFKELLERVIKKESLCPHTNPDKITLSTSATTIETTNTI